MASTTAVPTAPQLTQEYLAASDKHTNPSGRTDYLHAHPPGMHLGDTTTYHPGQALWGYPNDLPPIAYQLNHEAANRILANGDLPLQCRDQNGQLMSGVVKDRKKGDKAWPIMDFAILPAHISQTVPEYLPVLWMRYDGRLELNDILARMDNTASRPTINTFSMRCARWRFDNCLKSWNDAHGRFTTLKEQEEVEALLTPQQIQANTTRGLTPGPSQGWGPPAIVPVVSRRDRQAQVEAAKDARYFNVNNLSSLSESETDVNARQGTNKRSRRSRAQHRKKARHILKKQEAIKEAIQSGLPGHAVTIPGRSAELVLQFGKPLVIKNVIVIPDEDDNTSDEDQQNSEQDGSGEGDCNEIDAMVENDYGEAEEDKEDEFVNDGDDEFESQSGECVQDENSEDTDDNDNGSGTRNQGSNTEESHGQRDWVHRREAGTDPILPPRTFLPFEDSVNEPVYDGSLQFQSLESDYESPSTKKRLREDTISDGGHSAKRRKEVSGPRGYCQDKDTLPGLLETSTDTIQPAMLDSSDRYAPVANNIESLPNDVSYPSAMVTPFYDPMISQAEEDPFDESSAVFSTGRSGPELGQPSSASLVSTGASYANASTPGNTVFLDDNREDERSEWFLT